MLALNRYLSEMNFIDYERNRKKKSRKNIGEEKSTKIDEKTHYYPTLNLLDIILLFFLFELKNTQLNVFE